MDVESTYDDRMGSFIQVSPEWDKQKMSMRSGQGIVRHGSCVLEELEGALENKGQLSNHTIEVLKDLIERN